jgi:L-threonylcarbamoyladenylate synthase
MNATTTASLRPADSDSIAEAAWVLRRGGLVVFPTETVYGLGADATNGEAIARVFEAKGRPRFNPLIVHVRDADEAEKLAHFTPLARKLAAAFWPGALTLVLPRRESPISLLVSAGLDTIALRVPAHPVAARLLESAGVPVAAPSANPSGRVSATEAKHVASELGDRVDLILDGGATPLGLESTVIGFDRDQPLLLRAGAIARAEIEKIAGALQAPADAKVRSPGQLASHYAPRAPLRLNAGDMNPGEALLAFGANVPAGARMTLNLSTAGNLREAAANLFSMLRTLDASGAVAIAVMPIPENDLGEAINDRLARAAAPRNAS